MSRLAVRKFKNGIATTLAMGATLVGLLCLGAILWTLIKNGLAGVSLDVFTKMTPPPAKAADCSTPFSAVW